MRKYMCWLLGHKSILKLWEPSRNKLVTISIPTCKHCGLRLTPLPIEMHIEESHYRAYKEMEDMTYKRLYEDPRG